MFHWIKRLFGEGTCVLKGETYDGRTFTIKVPFVGNPDTIDCNDIHHLKVTAEAQYGVRIRRLSLTDILD